MCNKASSINLATNANGCPINGLEHFNEEDIEEEIEEKLYEPSRKSSRAGVGGGGRGSGSSSQSELRLPAAPTTQVRGVSRARAGPPGPFG